MAQKPKPVSVSTDHKTCEALGYVWTFEPNTMLEDLARSQLNNAAGLFYNSISRPAARLAAADLLFPAFSNIMSSVVEISRLENPDEEADRQALAAFVTEPQKWIDLAGAALRDNRAEEIRKLHDTALSANPHWPGPDVDDTPETAEEAEEGLARANANLETLEGQIEAGEQPDAVLAEDALVDAGTLVKAREAKAKKKRA